MYVLGMNAQCDTKLDHVTVPKYTFKTNRLLTIGNLNGADSQRSRVCRKLYLWNMEEPLDNDIAIKLPHGLDTASAGSYTTGILSS